MQNKDIIENLSLFNKTDKIKKNTQTIDKIINEIQENKIKFDIVLFHNPCQDGMLSFSLLYHYRPEWFNMTNLDVIFSLF